MNDYSAASYGDRIAEVYDELHVGFIETGLAVATLAEIAAGGSALELGIGTGRVALPLAAQGIAVHGIDASEAMVVKLHAKPGGADIPVTIGDFTTTSVPERFSLVYCVFNTIFAPLTQNDQVRCFRNAASHLTDGGAFLIEAFVPDLSLYSNGQRAAVTRIDSGRVMLDVAMHDPVGQLISGQHVLISESGTRLYPVKLRYAWPAELDLMARLTGLRLEHRWGGWQREPFTAASTKHISVYHRD